MANLFLGLDGGGTKCRARVIDPKGGVVFEAVGGPANFATTPREIFVKSLREALAQAPRVQSACLCLAGILTDLDKKEVADHASSFLQSETIDVRPDFHAAVAACPSSTDACVILGTGSLVASLRGTEIVKSGGGGYLLGDDGSAFSLGRAGLRNLYLNDEPLAGQALAIALQGMGEKSKVISQLYKLPTPVDFIARLAPAVLADFHAGLPYAKRAIKDANDPLWTAVIDHLSKECGERDEYRISACGGVVENDNAFFDYWLAELNLRLARARNSRGNILGAVLKTPPVEGACRLAILNYEH